MKNLNDILSWIKESLRPVPRLNRELENYCRQEGVDAWWLSEQLREADCQRQPGHRPVPPQ